MFRPPKSIGNFVIFRYMMVLECFWHSYVVFGGYFKESAKKNQKLVQKSILWAQLTRTSELMTVRLREYSTAV